MRASRSSLEQEVASLGDLPRDQLTAFWTNAHGTPPPTGVRRELLVRSAAWYLQAKRLGGFTAETRRLLRSAVSRLEHERAVRDRETGNATDARGDVAQCDEPVLEGRASATMAVPTRQRRRLSPGARLIREWGGRTHVVDVIEGGYVFEAQVYPSLTAIAGQITGAHWSGPRFFGL